MATTNQNAPLMQLGDLSFVKEDPNGNMFFTDPTTNRQVRVQSDGDKISGAVNGLLGELYDRQVTAQDVQAIKSRLDAARQEYLRNYGRGGDRNIVSVYDQALKAYDPSGKLAELVGTSNLLAQDEARRNGLIANEMDSSGASSGTGTSGSSGTSGTGTSGTSGTGTSGSSGTGTSGTSGTSGSTTGSAAVIDGRVTGDGGVRNGSTTGAAGATQTGSVTYSPNLDGGTLGTAQVIPGSGVTYTAGDRGGLTGNATVTPGSGVRYSTGTNASQQGTASVTPGSGTTYSASTNASQQGVANVTPGSVTQNRPQLPADYASLAPAEKATLYASLRRAGFTDSDIRTAAGPQSESLWQELRRMAGYDLPAGGTVTAATPTGTAAATPAKVQSTPAVTAGQTQRVVNNNWGGLLAAANDPMAAGLSSFMGSPTRPGIVNGALNPFATPTTRVQLPQGVTPPWLTPPGG